MSKAAKAKNSAKNVRFAGSDEYSRTKTLNWRIVIINGVRVRTADKIAPRPEKSDRKDTDGDN